MKRFPSGQAVFLPLGRTLWTLRRQTMQAIREGARPESYTIIGEETYFPDVLDSILCDLETRMEELEQYFELAFGKATARIAALSYGTAMTEKGCWCTGKRRSCSVRIIRQ